jgi:hypothetical protein
MVSGKYFDEKGNDNQIMSLKKIELNKTKYGE